MWLPRPTRQPGLPLSAPVHPPSPPSDVSPRTFALSPPSRCEHCLLPGLAYHHLDQRFLESRQWLWGISEAWTGLPCVVGHITHRRERRSQHRLDHTGDAGPRGGARQGWAGPARTQVRPQPHGSICTAPSAPDSAHWARCTWLLINGGLQEAVCSFHNELWACKHFKVKRGWGGIEHTGEAQG